MTSWWSTTSPVRTARGRCPRWGSSSRRTPARWARHCSRSTPTPGRHGGSAAAQHDGRDHHRPGASCAPSSTACAAAGSPPRSRRPCSGSAGWRRRSADAGGEVAGAIGLVVPTGGLAAGAAGGRRAAHDRARHLPRARRAGLAATRARIATAIGDGLTVAPPAVPPPAPVASRLGIGLAALGRPAYLTSGRHCRPRRAPHGGRPPRAYLGDARRRVRGRYPIRRRCPLVRVRGGVPRRLAGRPTERRRPGRRVEVGLPIRRRLAARRRGARGEGPLAGGVHHPARADPGPAGRPTRRLPRAFSRRRRPACSTTRRSAAHWPPCAPVAYEWACRPPDRAARHGSTRAGGPRGRRAAVHLVPVDVEPARALGGSRARGRSGDGSPGDRERGGGQRPAGTRWRRTAARRPAGSVPGR